jgi:hypothetical protein
VNLSPPGHQYTAGVVAAGVPARAFTWKHGFAGLNILNSAFVVDGLNDAGLSAAYLWQESAMLISNYTTDGPEFALAADDLLAYILGTFSDVDEAVEFMSSGTFQVRFLRKKRHSLAVHIWGGSGVYWAHCMRSVHPTSTLPASPTPASRSRCGTPHPALAPAPALAPHPSASAARYRCTWLSRGCDACS